MASSKPQANIALCFTDFTNFPKEIQLEIWFQALPEGQLVYHDSYGPFEPPKPSALYYACLDSREVYLKHYKQLYLHNLTCSHVGASSETYPSFYNPIKDTLVYTCADHLLLLQIRCCSTENNLLSQARHIAFVAGRECYAPHRSPTPHNPRYDPLALSPEFGFGLWKYIYEHFLYINPSVESVAYVVGRDTINKTARSYPEMRLVTTIQEFGKHPLFKWKHWSNIGEKYYENTINDIRSGFEKWKEMHPEAKVPRIEMAFPRKKYRSR
ncbi:uncharacterized protein Bfra_001295 [Botrytis fragariae]|uniref:2EXR domain-containing protein n=1 Tax=Botrytis fragariae TaxID=1964551 RepID=A0A8H6B0L3_9HELO|nr:uncharacterized protein Bfra_001295 [Botrytis fragariae]KAF5876937.1 hypothetical protein Bfra_001295 [Botrytis fragariae]